MDIVVIVGILGVVVSVLTQLLKQFNVTTSDTAKLVCAGLATILTVVRVLQAGGELEIIELTTQAAGSYAMAIGFYETVIRPYWPWKDKTS